MADVPINQRRLRLGMIGGGRGSFIGAVHRMAARLDDRYEFLAGALSADPDRARASGADLRLDPARSYPDIDALIAGERARPDPVDVVAIVTPNHLHHRAARACLDAGFHVICDKPLTTTLVDAEDLCTAAERHKRILAVTYNYSGYPLVRAARELVAAGELGRIHRVNVEYLQDWLLKPREADGNKQAVWRTDPARSGAAGCLGDIGTHAFQLAEFVTGLQVTRLAGRLDTIVPGRRVDDDAQAVLEFDNGAGGTLWASQVATGHENGLRLRVYGDRAALEWHQEFPNELHVRPFGEPPRRLTRGSTAAGERAAAATRIPPGHPEGYLEAFAQLYRDIADRITAHDLGRQAPPDALLVPTGKDGLRGIRFVQTVLDSHDSSGAWLDLPP